MRIVYKQCPRCGSKDTLKIVYGMPTVDLFNNTEYWIGGCCIEIGDDDEQISPQYHCKACGHEWNKKQAIHDWYSSIESLTFSMGGFVPMPIEIVVDFKNFNIQWGSGFSGEKLENSKSLSKHEIETILNVLIDSDFSNWKANYINKDIIDGLQWEIEYTIKNKKRRISCQNKFPDKWGGFYDILKSFIGEEVI